MIKIFKTFGGYIEIPSIEHGCWINVTNPTDSEIQHIVNNFGMPQDSINDILDIDERPRVEFEDEWTLIILRIPVQSINKNLPFHTIPLGIFFTDKFTLTFCLQDNDVLPTGQPSFLREQYRHITDKINFVLRLFLRSANTYLLYLKQINQMTAAIEQDLEKSIKNRELNELLKMEKCLVFFITSLKGNEIVLTRLKTSKRITTEINEDLLEDAMIENKQALETAQIYSNIQSGMMDAFASVISNNLNEVMKQLTLISIIMMIPTLVASIFGMNVPNFMESVWWAMPVIIFGSVLIVSTFVAVFKHRKWF